MTFDPTHFASCDLQEVEAGLQLKAWNFLSEAYSKAEEEVQSCAQDRVDSSSITDTYMAVANFCDKILREHEQRAAGEGQIVVLTLELA